MVIKRILKLLNKLLRKIGLYKAENSMFEIRIKNKTIKIPVILGLSCEISETWMTDLLEIVLNKKEGIFLDVGVNLGQTLIKVKAIDPKRQYLGFEPNPNCVFYTKQLIRENQFENCMILPVGLFNEDSLLALNFIQDSLVDSAASLIQDFRPNHVIYRRLVVPVFRFEQVTQALPIGNIGIIKIDVEGAELEVIQTLQQTIHEHRPILLLEVLPVYEEQNTHRKERQKQLEQILRELDYVTFRVKKTIDDTYAGLKRIEAIEIHSDLRQCDYVVVPAELIPKEPAPAALHYQVQ